jgi:diguanylate cyclase (GGDEF)-like protein/PAS domain S-box-containing protein
MLKLLRFFTLLCWFFAAAYALAQPVARIGVLSFQSKTETLTQWLPTAHALQQAVPGTRFEVLALSYEELDAAVASGQLDFVLTNPEHYVVLRNKFKLRPMATINQTIGGQVVNNFGSVIFTRSDSAIQTLEQARGSRVQAVGQNSLGGYLMAADVFKNQQINLHNSQDAQLSFSGVPHSKVVLAVLAGQADVGIVRTGVLEQMVSAGKLKLNQLRVLNPQPSNVFPQLLSTELFAEWPWAAMPNTPALLTKAVLLKLLAIEADSVAARDGRYQGFSIPANYTPVEDLMRRLRVYPGMHNLPVWLELWQNYQGEIALIALVLLLLGLSLAAYLWRSNRRLLELTRQNREAQASLELSAAAFNSQIGLIVTDGVTSIQRANAAMADILGFSQDDLHGKTTSQLRSPMVSEGTMRLLWADVQKKGRWRGELLCQHKDGYAVDCLVTISTISNPLSGLGGFVGSFIDISAQKKAEREIRELAFFDPLTHLPNRRMFLETLQTSMERALQEGSRASLIFIDLDHFKNLNDAHGHTVGDELLRLMSQRLSLLLGPSNMAARLGGDEFVVMLTGLDAQEDRALKQAMQIAQDIHQALLTPFELQAQNDFGLGTQTLRYTCSGSIGVALYGFAPEPLTEVLKRADVAMYKAKQDGRNLIRQYDPLAQQALNMRMALSNDLNLALRDNQFKLLYQVQVDANSRAIGVECLMRWQHPLRGMVSPADFIPLAEDTGAIVAMGEWVLREACATLAQWSHDAAFRHLTLSVNISPRQLTETNFVDRVTQILQKSGAPAKLLRLEVTEGIVMQDTQEGIAKMRQLCALGLTFSIDDFGTGYSSLSYIQMLPLAELKIDKSFVNDLTTSERAVAIVKAVIALGHSMNVCIVSEGVETLAQKEQLLALGSTLLQGYLISRPIELAALEQWITQVHSA